MNDLYVTGVVCSFIKVNSKSSCSSRVGRLMAFVWGFLHKVEMTALRNVEMTRGSGLCGLKPYTLCLITLKLLFCVCLAHARQSSSPEAANGVALQADTMMNQQDVDADADLTRFPLVKHDPDFSLVKPLMIDDPIPDYLWDLPLWVVNHPTGRDTITLREYGESKLLVLDFWARWCGPCIISMDKWEAFARELSGELALIGVHMDFDYKALPFSRKKGWKSPMVIGENARIINKHFFRAGRVTRAVWIKEGRLFAITDNDGYDVETVREVARNGGSVKSNLLGTYMENEGP